MVTLAPVAATTPLRPAPAPERPVPTARSTPVLTTAETAECTCPDFCERDHANE
jgi:hypothetical protein